MIESYDKLPLYKWFEINEILTSEDSDIDKQVDMICVLGDYERDYVEGLKLEDYSRLVQKTRFILTLPKTEMPEKFYTLGEFRLEPMLNARDMNVAQYTDYSTYLQLENMQERMIGLISVFLIPKGKKYNDGYSVDRVKELILTELTVDKALSLSAFFLEYTKAWLKGTQTYLVKRLKKMKLTKEQRERMEKALADLEAAGDMLR